MLGRDCAIIVIRSSKLWKQNVKIFISYRRADSQAITDRMHDRLASKFGKENVFQDVLDIKYGDDFRQVLQYSVQQADVVLVIIGVVWATITFSDSQLDKEVPRLFDENDFVRIEVETGLNSTGITLIPVLVNGATLPSINQLPLSLHPLVYLNAATVRNNPYFEDDIERLTERLKEIAKSDGKHRLTLRFSLLFIVLSVIVLLLINVLGNSNEINQNHKVISSCGNNLPWQFQVTDKGLVVNDISLRDSPNGTPLTNSNVERGQSFVIIDGPVCSTNGVSWWKVETEDTRSGWLPEGNNKEYFLTAPTIEVLDLDCPSAVENALDVAAFACEQLSKDQLCYGHSTIEVTYREETIARDIFNNPGDIIDISLIDTIQLSSMNIETNSWGIALVTANTDLMNVQNSQREVLIVLTGSFEPQNTSQSMFSPGEDVLVYAPSGSTFMYTQPSAQAEVVGLLSDATRVEVTGDMRIMENENWWKVQTQDGVTGWMPEGVRQPNLARSLDGLYAPVSAYYFQTGVDDPKCKILSRRDFSMFLDNGQVATFNLRFNEVEIKLQ
jgi:hypothetical protein